MDLGMPVSLHGGLGAPLWATGAANWDSHDFAVWLIARMELTTSGTYAATQLILSGVFDRLPEFRISTAETGASWIPFWMDQMDNNYYRHKYWAGFDLKQPPSEYVKQGHFLWSVIVDYPAFDFRHHIGVHNMTWASDFPHSACEWPRSRWLVDSMMKDVPEDEKYEMCWGNAARFYGLDA
jgi:predicted TIM-barrel fold metal-dependent hydrolase